MHEQFLEYGVLRSKHLLKPQLFPHQSWGVELRIIFFTGHAHGLIFLHAKTGKQPLSKEIL